MTRTYFLGANSKDGFYSLYSGFPGSGAMLHIIKGGPGNGKSGFMRRIGKAAEEHGFDVEYVLCSGDPDSLDGVYIPALKHAWVDGTAPHITEPEIFAVSSDYVNLGQFCRLPLSDGDCGKIRELTAAYKRLYSRAYDYISSASSIRSAALTDCAPRKNEKEHIQRLLQRGIKPERSQGVSGKRFLSAISCKGRMMLDKEITGSAGYIYRILPDDGGELLRFAADTAESLGADVIRCPYPLSPTELEAVLLPADNIAFVSHEWEIENAMGISQAQNTAYNPDAAQARVIYKHLTELAVKTLREAKTLHDGIESVYKPYMDFRALDKFTEKEIKRILK